MFVKYEHENYAIFIVSNNGIADTHPLYLPACIKAIRKIKNLHLRYEEIFMVSLCTSYHTLEWILKNTLLNDIF